MRARRKPSPAGRQPADAFAFAAGGALGAADSAAAETFAAAVANASAISAVALGALIREV